MNKTGRVLLLFCMILCCAFMLRAKSSVPAPGGVVSDFAGMLSPESKASVEAIAAEIKAKTSAEIAVLIINSLEGDSIESVAEMIFKEWGVGAKGKDNGVLLLIAKNDRKLRIEVGYGLEGAITDGTAGSIIDESILPFFKTGDFSTGVVSGTHAIAKKIAEEYNVGLTVSGVALPHGDEKYDILAVAFIIALFILIAFFNRRRGYYGGASYGGQGGRSSGGFGGGFGGFGGGMSGGGGSSRGW